MVNTFWSDGTSDFRFAIKLLIIQGLANLVGSLLLVALGSRIRHWQWQLTTTAFFMVVFGSLLALGSPSNEGMMLAFYTIQQLC